MPVSLAAWLSRSSFLLTLLALSVRGWFAPVSRSYARHRHHSALLERALRLFLVTSIARACIALTVLGVAYYSGTGPAMDAYVAYSMVSAACVGLANAALPTLVLQRLHRQHAPNATVAAEVRRWAWKTGSAFLTVYVLLAAPLAWLYTPGHDWDAARPLLTLLVLGAGGILLSPAIAVEQALVQAAGQSYRAALLPLWSAVTSLSLALVSAKLGGIYLCAFGVSLGVLLEYRASRRANQACYAPAVGSAAPRGPLTPYPLHEVLALTLAAGGFLLTGFLDQWVLSSLGPSAQSSWSLACRIPSFLGASLTSVGGILWSAGLAPGTSASPVSRRRTWKLCGLVFGMTCVAMGLASGFAHPLVSALYERGAFGPDETRQVAAILPLSVLAYSFFPAFSVLNRGIGVQAGYRILLASAWVYLGVKASLTAWCAHHFGVPGVAYATVAGSLAQFAVLVWGLAPKR